MKRIFEGLLNEAWRADVTVPVNAGRVLKVGLLRIGFPGRQPYLHAQMDNGMINSYAAKSGNHIADFFMKMKNEWEVPSRVVRQVEKQMADELRPLGYRA